MEINVAHIPEDGLNLHFYKDGEWFRNVLTAEEKMELSLQRADVICSVKKLKETIFIEGNIETIIATACSRCLEVTGSPLKSSFRYTLVPAERQFKEEQELSSEDLEYSYYENDLIDLDAMLFEQIMLQIPMRVLCKETCKGMCPHCGKDLNTTSCDCRTEFVDERLAVLKKLKKEE